ncbi:MAG: orotate phosphoribosyltransferase [Candidatus Lambdaproteobacteria bacterium]|nr:orotate phosphoribosyltransferase [Candidatus Lambdaproteobacteria bacterium]
MSLPPAKTRFLDFLLESQALEFGAFTLKSGRVSPYFFNSARFQSGPLLERLGDFYAEAALVAAPGATIVFGPAYKGIPLCLATAMALSRRAGRPIGYLFNRKEEKTHGDRGLFVGQQPGPGDRLLIVDDVITDGATKLEAVALLRGAFAAPIDALVIAFNRMERDAADRDAIAGFTRATGVPIHALVSLADLEQALAEGALGAAATRALPADLAARLRAYRERYGLPGA